MTSQKLKDWKITETENSIYTFQTKFLFQSEMCGWMAFTQSVKIM